MKFRVLILLLFALLSRVLAEPIYAAHTGGTFGRSYREPKYDIKFHSKSFPFHPDDDQESVIMPGKDGQRFLCYLPKVEKAKNGKSLSPQNVSSVVMESEKWVKVKTPDELLEALKDRCLLRQEGWWSYEFCHLGKVRQFHMEDEKVVQEFILGEYNAEATAAYLQNFSDNSILKDPRGKDASHRYHPHQFTNGTTCDLTDQPREIEVRFICAEPRAMITSITELSTCKYALTVQCPTLCKHPLFQEEKPVEHTINCSELPGDDKENRAEKDRSEPKQIVIVTDAAAEDSTDKKEIEE